MANAFVQKLYSAPNGTTNTSGAPAASTTAGNLLVVLVSLANNEAADAVTDSASNAYTKVPGKIAFTWFTAEAFYCFDAASVSSSGGWWEATSVDSDNGDFVMVVLEYSGLGAGSLSAYGYHNESSPSSTSNTVVDTNGTILAGDLIVTGAASAVDRLWDTDGAENLREDGQGGSLPSMAAADILSASGGSESITWNIVSGGADVSGAILLAFTPAGGGGGGLSIPVVMNQYRQRVA